MRSEREIRKRLEVEQRRLKKVEEGRWSTELYLYQHAYRQGAIDILEWVLKKK